MRVRQISLGIRGACALLAAGVMLFAVAEAGAVDTAAINSKVAAALAGPPNQVGDAIAAIFSGVPATEAGPTAAAVLAAVPADAPLGAKKAVGAALTTVSNTLAADGQIMFAKAIVTAMQDHAAATGDRTAIATYQAIDAAKSPMVPTGPVGVGLNTQNVSGN